VPRRRGVVLSIMAGHGHLIPALAIADGLRRRGCEAEVVDFLEVMRTPGWARALRGLWRLMLRYPSLERYLQRGAERRSIERFVLDRIRHLYRGRFRRWYERTHPDFIVITNFIPIWIVSGYLEDLDLPVELVAYNSDVFSAHSIYVCPRVRFYLSPEPGASMLIAKGQPADSVIVCPVPLRRSFTECTESRENARRRIGLADRFTLLLTLGGEGIGSLDVVRELGKLQADIQIVVLGHGAAGRAPFFTSLSRSFPSLLLVDAGFVEDPSLYVAASDLVAGKAGANSVCEALSLGRPFLITTAYHNVETTASWLHRHRVGRLESDPASQARIIVEMAESGERDPLSASGFDSLPMSFGADLFAALVIDLIGG
jgi:UDP-N-acetylglucosamine:LPS N-acetylglucosamine transferase